MTQIVTLPREVAEAIEKLRRLGKDNRSIIGAANGEVFGPNSDIVWKFASADSGNFELLLSALVNDYTVEQTPEDRLREYYSELKRSECRFFSHPHNHGCPPATNRMDAIKTTLNILGIKIEGVNA
jgi:hypothetical protein